MDTTLNGRALARRAPADWIARGALYLDTESTGLSSLDQVCEVAVLDGDGGILFDRLIRPPVPVSDKAREIHQIGDEALVDAPSYAEIEPELRAMLAGRLVVAYNADFDRRMLHQSAAAHSLPPIEADYQCAMRTYAAYFSNREGARWQRLIDAAGNAGIRWGPRRHRARDDTRVLIELVRYMARPE